MVPLVVEINNKYFHKLMRKQKLIVSSTPGTVVILRQKIWVKWSLFDYCEKFEKVFLGDYLELFGDFLSHVWKREYLSFVCLFVCPFSVWFVCFLSVWFVCMYVCLFDRFPIFCLFVCPLVLFHFVRLFVCLFIYLFLFVRFPSLLFVCLFVCLFACLSVSFCLFM